MSDASVSTNTTEATTPTTAATAATPSVDAPVSPQSGESANPSSLLDIKPESLPFDAEKLSLADGFDKNDHFKDFVALATEEKLPQGTAQKLIDLYQKAAEVSANAAREAWQAQNEKWQQEVKADPEVGGNKLAGVLQTVSRVMDNPELTDPHFREALSFTGAGNHPAIVRTLAKWAGALSEAKPIAGNPPGTNGQTLSLADRLYPGGPRATINRE